MMERGERRERAPVHRWTVAAAAAGRLGGLTVSSHIAARSNEHYD